MLGKLPVLGRPTNLDYSRARAYLLAVGAGGDCLDIFSLNYHFSGLSPSLWETARYRLKYCLKGRLSPKQPTNRLHKLYTVKRDERTDRQTDRQGQILMPRGYRHGGIK